MSPITAVRRAVSSAADAATATAGAVGGAVVTGAIGAIEGAAAGAKNGLKSGSRSTPLAALTLAAVGVTGLVDWPILLAVGGGAVVIHELGRWTGSSAREPTAEAGRKSVRKRAPKR